MSKYIDVEKLIAEIERWRDKAKEKYNESTYSMGRCDALAEFRNHIVSLLEGQPYNEDIDKVAQELYEYLYELKRRNNVPTNLYDKQEIIDLWKAGIEYGRNHPKQEQPEKSKKDCNVCPHCVDRKDQYGWHFKGCFGGQYKGKFIAEIDECPLKQEQPEVDLEKEIEEWIIKGKENFELDGWVAMAVSCAARHFYELGLNAEK